MMRVLGSACYSRGCTVKEKLMARILWKVLQTAKAKLTFRVGMAGLTCQRQVQGGSSEKYRCCSDVRYNFSGSGLGGKRSHE
eukprot:2942426-Pyramimonas_sp.AAC.1